MRRRVLQIQERFYVITFLVSFILQPQILFGEGNPEHPNKIEIKDSRVTVDVQDAEIADFLTEVQKGTGVKITIDSGLVGKKVTAKFEDKDVESALRELLLGYFYVLSFSNDPTDKEKKTLKEVKAGGPAIGSKLLERTIITKEIAYGKGREDVGAVDEGEGALIGPRSFAVSDKGGIYICDTVNRRVQIFSPAGNYLATIPLEKEIFAEDIVIDPKEFIYIYDRMTMRLYQYEKNGTMVTFIDVDENRWGRYGGSMHIVNNEIDMFVCDPTTCGDYVIGRVSANGLLIEPSDEDLRPFKEQGMRGLSGRKYMTRLKRFEEGNIEIKEKDGATSETLVFPREFLGMQFLGEDSTGNTYVETNRNDKNNRLVVDVHKFDRSGNYLSTFNMPMGNIHFRSAKILLVDKEGTIYKFLPGKDKLSINIFPPESNQ